MSTATTLVLREFWLVMTDHLWQSSLFIALLFVLAPVLRHAPPRLRNNFWRLGVFKLLLPLPLLAPLLSSLVPASLSSGSASGSPRLTDMIQVTWAPAGVFAYSGGFQGHALDSFLMALTWIWCAGALLLLTLLVRDTIRSGRRSSVAMCALAPPLAIRISAALERTTIPPARVHVSDDGTMPSATGILHRKIIVPARLVHDLPVNALGSVLLHENAHCRRHDAAVAHLGRLALALFFFNPLIWILNRRLGETAELAADEAVLAAGISASSYRWTLSRSIALALAPTAPPAMARVADRSFLSRRISLLSLPRKEPAMLRHRLLVTSCAVLVLAMLFTSPPQFAGDEVSDPVLIPASRVQPDYPESARKAGITGEVVLAATIDTGGRVTGVKVVSSPDGGEDLELAAVKALHQWRYQPAQKDGQPVASQFKVVIRFHLDSGKDHPEPEPGPDLR